MMNIVVLALGALASNYPPDYEVSRSCQTVEHVQVCAINRGANNPRLEVTYLNTGTLWNKANPIALWLSVNNVPGQLWGDLTEIKKDGKVFGAQYTLNQLKNVQYCYQATIKDAPDYSPGVARCPVNKQFGLIGKEAKQGEMIWYFDPANPFEQDQVLGWEWNVQIAFVNHNRQWDSKFGENYRFKFA